MPDIIAFFGGALVAFSLAVFGGGGSILATPILAFGVGLAPHVAIGTSALAVALNAVVSLIARAQSTPIAWASGIIFALAGVTGAIAGAFAGQLTPGGPLLAAFGVLMIAVASIMIRRPFTNSETQAPRTNAPRFRRLTATGGLVGVLSGYFGIGGGFLAAPGIAWAARLPLYTAAATSLIAVASFGATTGIVYALDGDVSWRALIVFVAGGVAGALAGAVVAKAFAKKAKLFNAIFAGMIALVGVYTIVSGLRA